MSQITDVIVVGGGIIGCFIAYELSKAGRQVILVEKDELGAEASSASAGLLVPLHGADSPLFDLYLTSTRLFSKIVPVLQEETGIDVEYVAAGLLEVAAGEDEAQALRAEFQAWQETLDTPLIWLDKQAIHALEPELGPTVAGGILAEEGAAINSGRMVFALARAASAQNAQFRLGCPATGFRSSGSRVVALKTNDGEIAADQVVIAAGAWSRVLAQQLGLSIPIAPARGQMLSLKPIDRLVRLPILGNVGSLSSKADGTIHVGGTVDLAGFNKQLRPEDTASLIESAATLIPRLREGPIDKIWTGLRPYCADGLPVIGKMPGWDNVTIAAGHFKLGITGSAITGKIIKDLVVEGQSDLLIEALSPARFMGAS